MIRINPITKKKFTSGEVGPDGRIFVRYDYDRKTKDGFFRERWTTSEGRQQGLKLRCQKRDESCSTVSGRLSAILSNIKIREKHPRISLDDMIEMWDNQQGLCAYTGWEMSLEGKNPRLVSIDRIDNRIGYEKNNCVLTCWCVNKAKAETPIEDFFEMCKLVSLNSHKFMNGEK